MSFALICQGSKVMSRFSWSLRVSWWLIARIAPWMRSSQERYFENLESLMRPQLRVLDLGCGKEFLMRWLAPEKYRRWSASIVDQAVIFGIDPFFPSLLQNASDLNACALANHLPFPASSFDLVTANMVVEHIAEPDSVLQEVFRVLKPGGAFLFHTPNLSAPPIALSKVLPHSIKRRLVPVLEGGRQQKDVFSTYYRLNTKATIASAAGRSRYHVEWIQQVFSAPLTQMLGPFVIVELLLSRALTGERFASWRPDLICLLRKPSA
jgi:ubiquinone/menaquinone biosynthesis C-methylase UbiE